MSCLISIVAEREAIAFMLKVPRLKSYIKRKQVLSDENTAEIVG